MSTWTKLSELCRVRTSDIARIDFIGGGARVHLAFALQDASAQNAYDRDTVDTFRALVGSGDRAPWIRVRHNDDNRDDSFANLDHATVVTFADTMSGQVARLMARSGAWLGEAYEPRAIVAVQDAVAGRAFRDERRQRANVRPLVRAESGVESLYDPRVRGFVPVKDRTAEFAALPQAGVQDGEVEKFANRRRWHGAGAQILGQLQAGVTFHPGTLDYSDSTAIYGYLVAPLTKEGPAAADLLYMTATNRSFQGCEALIAYAGPSPFEGSFRIWDWYSHRLQGSGFIRSWNLSVLSDYLIPYTFNEIIDTSVLYVISSTRRLGRASQWVNEVFLHNHRTGERDRVWQKEFPWADPPRPDEWGWWGPIFEAFPENAVLGPCNPIGFDEALLVQDGYERQLTAANSSLAEPATGSGLSVVYRRGNTGLVAR